MSRRAESGRRPVAIRHLYSAHPRDEDDRESGDVAGANRRAVALRYRANEASAPTVRAKGSGRTADRILAVAREHDIPVQKDPALVEVLAKLDVGSLIPPNLFQAVAELLAMVYKTEKRFRGSSPGTPGTVETSGPPRS